MIQNKKSKKHIYAFVALLALVIFMFAAEFASKGQLATWEVSLINFIYGWPEYLKPVFLSITLLGSAWIVVIVPLVAWQTKQKILALRLFLAGASALFLMEAAKFLVDRPRPVFFLQEVLPRQSFVTGSGFPSGHTTIATAMALTLCVYLKPNQRYVALLWIVGVGLSRVYLGVHAPLDIVGGLALGTLIFCVYQLVFSARIESIIKSFKVLRPKNK